MWNLGQAFPRGGIKSKPHRADHTPPPSPCFSSPALQAATLDLLLRVDGAFYFRHGARMGQYVLTYVYQGHLQAEMVAVLVDSHGSLGLGWTRARQAGHYSSLREVVESALRPNSLLYCQLLLPELVGLSEVSYIEMPAV